MSILVVEGGTNNFDNPAIVNPLLFLSHLAPTSKTTLFYQGIEEAQLGGRQVVVPSGGVLGGGSSINFMMYARAQRSDWDAWQTPGWSADEMIPYLKKVYSIHVNNSLILAICLLVFVARDLFWARYKIYPRL